MHYCLTILDTIDLIKLINHYLMNENTILLHTVDNGIYGSELFDLQHALYMKVKLYCILFIILQAFCKVPIAVKYIITYMILV